MGCKRAGVFFMSRTAASAMAPEGLLAYRGLWAGPRWCSKGDWLGTAFRTPHNRDPPTHDDDCVSVPADSAWSLDRDWPGIPLRTRPGCRWELPMQTN